MKKILSTGLILMIVSFFSAARASDTLIFETCNRLYDAGQFREAYECYSSHDTNIYAVYMAAKTSLLLEETKEFKKYAKKLSSRKLRSAESYRLRANLYETEEEKLEVILKGLKKFRNDTILLIDLTNVYLESEKYELAMESVDRLILQSNGSLQTYYFTRGFLHDRQGKRELALTDYNKAIELDPTYFEPLYNAGVVYYNHAVEVYQEADRITNMNQYKQKVKEAVALLWKALPYFEKAHAIDPEDEAVNNTLKILQYRLQPDTKKEQPETSGRDESWE